MGFFSKNVAVFEPPMPSRHDQLCMCVSGYGPGSVFDCTGAAELPDAESGSYCAGGNLENIYIFNLPARVYRRKHDGACAF